MRARPVVHWRMRRVGTKFPAALSGGHREQRRREAGVGADSWSPTTWGAGSRSRQRRGSAFLSSTRTCYRCGARKPGSPARPLPPVFRARRRRCRRAEALAIARPCRSLRNCNGFGTTQGPQAYRTSPVVTSPGSADSLGGDVGQKTRPEGAQVAIRCSERATRRLRSSSPR